MNEKRHRRSIRLKGYDCTCPGVYFVTICTHQRACLFGDVVEGAMVLNGLGEIVRDEWFKTAVVRPNVRLWDSEFVVMPNHVHGIIWIMDDDVVGARRRRAPTTTTEQFGKPVSGSIPTIVRAFKSAVTKRINDLRGTPHVRVWQRNYYEHIIRDDESLNRIRQYIVENPMRWAFDPENPQAIRCRSASSDRPYKARREDTL